MTDTSAHNILFELKEIERTLPVCSDFKSPPTKSTHYTTKSIVLEHPYIIDNKIAQALIGARTEVVFPPFRCIPGYEAVWNSRALYEFLKSAVFKVGTLTFDTVDTNSWEHSREMFTLEPDKIVCDRHERIDMSFTDESEPIERLADFPFYFADPNLAFPLFKFETFAEIKLDLETNPLNLVTVRESFNHKVVKPEMSFFDQLSLPIITVFKIEVVPKLSKFDFEEIKNKRFEIFTTSVVKSKVVNSQECEIVLDKNPNLCHAFTWKGPGKIKDTSLLNSRDEVIFSESSLSTLCYYPKHRFKRVSDHVHGWSNSVYSGYNTPRASFQVEKNSKFRIEFCERVEGEVTVVLHVVKIYSYQDNQFK